MNDAPERKDAVILQQARQCGPFADMLRLAYQRHAAYAWAHGMEYWAIAGEIHAEMWPGGWGKIWLMKWAVEAGYQHVFWIDTDAAIVNGECDLRNALPEGKLIGACEHWAEWFQGFDIPRHFNVGVLYLRNAPLTLEFLEDWIRCFPGDKRWWEQGAFNQMIQEDRYKDAFAALPATWNATVNVNMVANPNVMGWHGVQPYVRRLDMMRSALGGDFLKFRV